MNVNDLRDQTPWMEKFPSEYLADHVRFCASSLDGPTDAGQAEGVLWRNAADFYGSSIAVGSS